MQEELKTLTHSKFQFTGQTDVYVGKVRDVYSLGEDYLAMVVTDRISAFDVVLPVGIPYKGQVLNQIASYHLDKTADIVPNWKMATPDPMVCIGHRCEPYKVEMVIRGYLTGSAWRAYKEGNRSLCGLILPDGMRENQAFPQPIITPTTKADVGHDENISREEIISTGLVNEEEYKQLESYTYKLFERGSEIAKEKGLILVDTKYEFGKKDGKIYLIDEIHTPDSSRYFYQDSYEDCFQRGASPKQLSKEFVRQWLIQHGFQGREEDKMPDFTREYVASVSERYIELYEKIIGERFIPGETYALENRIYSAVESFIKQQTNLH